MPPPCTAVGCTADAVVQWPRRPTVAQLAPLIALEEERRAAVLELADPQLPPPEFGPLPDAADTTVPIHACGPHAITMDLAAHTHQAVCTAPNPVDLPGCDCTPEPLPDDPTPLAATIALPEHWQ